jgi:hypothetical protein
MTNNKFLIAVFWLITTVASSGLTSGCTNEYIEDVSGICFESEVLPIFQSNCTQSGCHNATDRAEGYNLTNYAGIMRGVDPGNFKNSKVYTSLISLTDPMPRKPYNPLTVEQVSLIALWIEQGAQNTTGCGAVNCDTTNVSYSSSIKPILNAYCNGCHAGSAPQGDIDLTSYNEVKKYVNSGALLGSIAHDAAYSPMPKGGNKLNSCNIALIQKWIDSGALDN